MEPFLQNKSENPAPVLLWAANAGGYASQKKNLASLKLLDQIEQNLIASANQYPEFESGAAHRALADIYYIAPPFISVGSKKKALKHAQIAYKIDPHHPGNMLIMAKLFMDDGKEDKARALFKEVLILASPDRFPFDFVGWRAEALEGLDSPQGLKLSLSANG
jgi:tetratricopeptide (TPR) repeat protein